MQDEGAAGSHVLKSRLEELVKRWGRGEVSLKHIAGVSAQELHSIASQGYFFFLQGKLEPSRLIFEGLVALDPAQRLLPPRSRCDLLALEQDRSSHETIRLRGKGSAQGHLEPDWASGGLYIPKRIHKSAPRSHERHEAWTGGSGGST